jgi:phosphoribosylglycinamide formyltransferase-1
MPALPNPSQNQLSIQWPLPPQPGLTPPLRLAVLASGEGSNFEALVGACRNGILARTDVVQLIVNNPGCGAQQRAERLGVPWTLLDHRQRSRQELDQALVAHLQPCGVDLVVMAGWMRIVTPVLIEAYAGRLVNIHPSLLPSFRGLDAVGQALAAGVRLSGCTVHLVGEEVDAGEILMQAAVPVLADDDHSSLSARIQSQEHQLLPAAVALLGQRLGQRLRDPAQG